MAAFQIPDDTLEGVFPLDRAAFAVEVLEFDLDIVAAEQHQVLYLLRQAFEGSLDVELGMPRQGLNQLKVIGVAPVPTAYRAAGERQMRIRDDLLRIEKVLGAETVARRTSPRRTVEGEQARFEFAQGIVADGACEFIGEHELGAFRPVHVGNARHALTQPQGGLKGLGEALAQVGPHFEAIDDRFNGVLAAHIEFGRLIELHNLAVDARAHEAARLQFLDEFGMLALTLCNGGRQQHQGSPFRMLENGIDHLTHGLGGEVDVVIRTARRTGTGVQQAQVVIDLGDRSHRGARVVRGRFLLDRNRGRQALDGVDIRFLHHREELPGVRRQRFDIAPLTLGIDGVEGERGLAGTRKAGQYDQSISRQVEIDIFQVMGPGTPDADILHVTDYYTRGVKCG